MEFPQMGSGPNRKQIVDALRNTAQSASNMVAENASVPVDVLAWALRKAGVPIGDKPVMGSDWMREKGLTAPVQEGMSKAIGDTIGMVGPMGFSKAGSQAIIEGGKKLKGLPVGMSIKPVDYGLPVNKDGTVSLFHGTSPEGADAIVNTKTMKSAGEPNIYFTTAEDAGYGTGGLVKVDVHPKYLNLDDEFPTGRLDFSVDAPQKMFKVANATRVK
jgi:hypothetical protein